MNKISIATAAALALFSTAAIAAVTYDGATGTGFVGKGDVQLALGLNNKGLQDNAANIQFRFAGESVTEVSWECTNTRNENVQERARTTTTSLEGVVDSVARERNQITGFNLNGYAGAPTSSSTTDGPPLNSCPNPNSGFVLSTPAGDPEIVSEMGGLQVSKDGVNWVDLI